MIFEIFRMETKFRMETMFAFDNVDNDLDDQKPPGPTSSGWCSPLGSWGHRSRGNFETGSKIFPEYL